MADKTNTDNPEKGWYWSHLAKMGRARGLMEASDRIRNRGRGLRPHSPPTVGHGRARARALLLEIVTRSHGRAPNPTFYPRGRGPRSLSPSHPGRGIRARILQPTPHNNPSFGRDLNPHREFPVPPSMNM